MSAVWGGHAVGDDPNLASQLCPSHLRISYLRNIFNGYFTVIVLSS